MKNLTKRWNEHAKKLLLNRRIVSVKYMDNDEAKKSLWDDRPVRIILDDGTNILPMSDDEGNNGGALWFGTKDGEDVLPVLRGED
tara:strand:- start:37 stop:291 length:255 start_codon:yes stop_codon:yes gene_type:complete